MHAPILPSTSSGITAHSTVQFPQQPHSPVLPPDFPSKINK